MRPALRAQALVFLAVALPMFVGIAGLAIDGALLLAQRRELQSAVDGAARAGATRVDMERLRASAGSTIQLDQSAAYAAANSYLGTTLARTVAWHARPTWRIELTTTRVRVTVEGRMATAFLRVVGIDEAPVNATADAAVQFGIRTPSAPEPTTSSPAGTRGAIST